jgi:hypothetical protein
MKNNTNLTHLILNTGETTIAPPRVFCPNLRLLLEPMLVKQGSAIPEYEGWYTQIRPDDGYAFFVVCDDKHKEATITYLAWTSRGAKNAWILLTLALMVKGIRFDYGMANRPASTPWLATYFTPTIATCPVNRRWIEGFTLCLAAAMISREMAREKIMTDPWTVSAMN